MEKQEQKITLGNRKGEQESLLGTGPIHRLFFSLAVPAILAQMINILYNLVDKMFIGHIPVEGPLALAGVGITTPVILAISALAALVSMGGAPKASIMMGRQNYPAAEEILGTCTWMILVLSLLLTVFMRLCGRPVLLLFGASSGTIGYALDYMNIYCLGTVLIQLTLGLNAFITAEGFTKISMLNVAVGAVCNVVLDYVIINLLHWGVEGAALATILSQGVSALCVVGFLLSRHSTLKLRLKNIVFRRDLLLPCILLGTSPALMQLTENMVAISFNTSLQRFGGDMAVSSMSIMNSIMQFVMLLLPGLVQGAQPILSYNLGAEKIDRVRDCFRDLLVSCVAGSCLIWALCMLRPDWVAAIFTDNAQLIQYSSGAIRIYLSMLFLYGVQVACQYSFVALDQAPTAIFLTIWRKIILLIPLIFILPHLVAEPVTGVFLAEPIADTVAVCTTGPMFYRYFSRLKRKYGVK